MRIERTAWRVIGPALIVALLASCVATQPAVANDQRILGLPGFWAGLWHGLIAPIAFVVSLFSDHLRIYAAPNAGRWYDFGFMLGIHGFSGGVFAGSRSRGRSATRGVTE